PFPCSSNEPGKVTVSLNVRSCHRSCIPASVSSCNCQSPRRSMRSLAKESRCCAVTVSRLKQHIQATTNFIRFRIIAIQLFSFPAFLYSPNVFSHHRVYCLFARHFQTPHALGPGYLSLNSLVP